MPYSFAGTVASGTMESLNRWLVRTVLNIIKKGIKEMTEINKLGNAYGPIDTEVKPVESDNYASFAAHEEERKSITIIIHSCSECGNTFKYPVIVTVISNSTDENNAPTENDIPGVVCGNH